MAKSGNESGLFTQKNIVFNSPKTVKQKINKSKHKLNLKEFKANLKSILYSRPSDNLSRIKTSKRASGSLRFSNFG